MARWSLSLGLSPCVQLSYYPLRPGRPWRREWPGAVSAGMLSGVLVGASGMSGPPVILFGLKQNWDHRILRASLIGYFGIVHALAVFVLWGLGIGGVEVVFQVLGILPGVFMGFAFGWRWRHCGRPKAVSLHRIGASLCIGDACAVQDLKDTNRQEIYIVQR